jgi:hypothetical protein
MKEQVVAAIRDGDEAVSLALDLDRAEFDRRNAAAAPAT